MKSYQKDALTVAKDLGYPPETRDRIINSKNEIEVIRALTTARQEWIKRERQSLCFDKAR